MVEAFSKLTENERDVYAAIMGFITAFGLLGNILFAITIFVRGLDSKFTTYMVRNQAIVDSMVCFITMMLVIFPKPLKSSNEIFDIIICRIWTSQALFWLLVLCSVYTLVFTAFDRYWAVMTPQKYKQGINQKLILAYSIIFGMCTFITLPSFLQSKYSNGTCTADLQYDGDMVKILFKAYSIIWFLAIYGVPTPIMIYIYAKIWWQLNKSMKGNNESNMKSAMKSFTKGTAVATIIFVFTISYDAIYYMLGYLEIATYTFNSPIQLVGVVLTAINSAKNPIVFFALVKTFRQTFILIWCRCLAQRSNRKVSVTQLDSYSAA